MPRVRFNRVMSTVGPSLTFGTEYEIGIDYKTAKLRVRGL
jgi:hypothetical protein